MSSLKKAIVLVMGIMSAQLSAWASSSDMMAFRIEYDAKSKYDKASLKNREILIQMHSQGNSTGRIKTITNNKQEFTINSRRLKQPVVHILSIKVNGKALPCRGVSESGSFNIYINCQKR